MLGPIIALGKPWASCGKPGTRLSTPRLRLSIPGVLSPCHRLCNRCSGKAKNLRVKLDPACCNNSLMDPGIWHGAYLPPLSLKPVCIPGGCATLKQTQAFDTLLILMPL